MSPKNRRMKPVFLGNEKSDRGEHVEHPYIDKQQLQTCRIL